MKSIYVVLPTASSISTEFAAIKARYDEQQAKHNAHEYMYPVRKIICKGCGKTFYTIVKSKKYCDYYTCGKLGNWKRQRQKRLAQRTGLVCRCCGKTFTPKRKDAVYCSNACRQKSYRQSVTDKSCDQKRHMVEPQRNFKTILLSSKRTFCPFTTTVTIAPRLPMLSFWRHRILKLPSLSLKNTMF